MTGKEQQLAAIIKECAEAVLGSKLENDGFSQTFYTKEEWADRGESYGRQAELIVTHDGGDYAPLFNLDYGEYDLFDAMADALRAHGYWAEQCTSWYTAIYKK